MTCNMGFCRRNKVTVNLITGRFDNIDSTVIITRHQCKQGSAKLNLAYTADDAS